MDSASSASSLFIIGTSAAILFLLICSAIFSGSETALTTASRAKLHGQAERGDKRARRALALTDDKERLIGAVLLGNNLVNIMATSLATMLFTVLLGDGGVAVATLIMTALVLIFSEVLPKTYAITNAEPLARRVSGLIAAVVTVAAPIVAMVQFLVRTILRAFGVTNVTDRAFAAHEEIAGAISLHHFEGSVQRAERDRLLGALDLSQLTVADVMTHRRDVGMIDIDQPPADIISQVLAAPYTRFPVYRGDSDDIIGVLHTKDLFRAIQDAVLTAGAGAMAWLDIASVMRAPYFVPELTSLDNQMHAFLHQKTHLAIVVDEYGAMRGLVTLEDILEEIVGEITDEHDLSPEAMAVRNDDGSVDVAGDTPIRDINRAMEWGLPEDEAVTVAGIVIHEARYLPAADEEFSVDGYRFRVLAREGNRLTRLRITRAG